MNRILGPALLTALAITTAGCAHQRAAPLYGWGNYQQEVYTYFKADGPGNEEQIAALEDNLRKLIARGQAAPPGYHAHLGMLYAAVGKDDQLVRELETEKSLFPESGRYMNFLLRRYRQQEVK